MKIRNAIGLAAGLVVGAMALAGPASAGWYENGVYHHDNRVYTNHYYGYHYQPPPVVYSQPYNYGYVAPPVVYDNAPGFSINIRP